MASNQTVGATGEALVASEFARRGYTVGYLTGNAKDIDLLVYKQGVQLAVQVKAVRSGSLQYDFGKYIVASYDEETSTQTIGGARPELDRRICFIVVFLGKKLGKDRFYCTTLGEFADYVALSTKAYFQKNNGVRPGNNRKSRHGATKESEFPPGLFSSLDEFLERTGIIP